MASAEGDIEGGEIVLILAAVGFGLYILSGWLKTLNNATGIGDAVAGAVEDFLVGVNSIGATVSGPSAWVGGSQALTPAQVDSIQKVSGKGNGILSVDGLTLTFPDGTYYSNITGQFFSSNGVASGTIACPGDPTIPDFSNAI